MFDLDPVLAHICLKLHPYRPAGPEDTLTGWMLKHIRETWECERNDFRSCGEDPINYIGKAHQDLGHNGINRD